MAGYSGYSKSNNAVDAEANGRFPASRCDKLLGCKPGAVKALLTTGEWHHSSKGYNRVDYYDIAALLAVVAGDYAPEEWEDDAETVAAQLATLRAWKPAEKAERVIRNATVEWIDWSGSMTRPKATSMQAKGATVVERGASAIVTLPNGTTMTKRLTTRGFYYRAAA